MNFQVVIDALTKIITNIVTFIPNLVNGLIILLVGYVVARLSRWIVVTILQRLRVDPMLERTGITGSLRGLGVTTPLSLIIGQAIFALLLLSFLITATQLMELTAVAQLLQQLLNFLPSVIAALIIFLLGGVVAQFVGNLVTTVGAASGLHQATRIGRIVQYLISLFVAILALAELGIDTAILVTAITIMLAAFGLALGLALGLGARNTVTNVLAGYYIRQRFPVGHPISLNEIRGVVSSVGGINTAVITTNGNSVVIPNSTLVESLVYSPRQSPSSTPPTTPQQPSQAPE